MTPRPRDRSVYIRRNGAQSPSPSPAHGKVKPVASNWVPRRRERWCLRAEITGLVWYVRTALPRYIQPRASDDVSRDRNDESVLTMDDCIRTSGFSCKFRFFMPVQTAISHRSTQPLIARPTPVDREALADDHAATMQ
ncbi:hypothetical protein E4U17_007189 [Claviceps sp. LM77 group G4]|nr:hypothetical protein E4U17_007189 [Claviceps sp. LM77 group G4]